MLLRELTKESTESQFQAQLTSAHEGAGRALERSDEQPPVGSKRPLEDAASAEQGAK
jgi:hypothetical protein